MKSSRFRKNCNRMEILISETVDQSSCISRPTHTSLSLDLRNSTPSNREGLSRVAMRRIFRARCSDLNISVFQEQESRFFKYCKKQVGKRRFSAGPVGLGSRSAHAIADTLRQQQNFAYINLSKNALGDAGVLTVSKAVADNRSIVHLDISSNDISPEGSTGVLACLSRSCSLTSLNISSHEGLNRNRLGIPGARELANYISKNKILSILNLSGCSIGAEGFSLISDSLSDSLISLNLSSNAVGSLHMQDFMRSVGRSSLLELKLSTNNIGNESCDWISALLVGGYGYCTLQRLDLSKNRITTHGVSKIFQGLKMNTRLQNLNLRENLFYSGPSCYFSECFKENKALLSLDLSRCHLKGSNMKSLSEALHNNTALQTLNLSHNELDEISTESLAKGLIHNSALKHLDMGYNRIRDKGAIALASALRANNSLETLNLAENCLKDRSGRVFCEYLRQNTGLLKINFEANSVSLKYVEDIKKLLASNRANYTRKLVPVLNKNIRRLKGNESDLQKINRMIQIREKEKTDIKTRCSRQVKKLEEAKEKGKAWLQELQEQLQNLRESRIITHDKLRVLETSYFVVQGKMEEQVEYWQQRIKDIDTEISLATNLSNN